jgi:hypothetical protein
MSGLTARAESEIDHGLVPAQVALVSEPKAPRAESNIVTLLVPCSVFGIGANAVLDYVLVGGYEVAAIALGSAVAWTLMLALLFYLLFRWWCVSGLSRT